MQPSAVMVVANRVAQQTWEDVAERRRLKWELTKGLYDVGYERQDNLELQRLIDWLLRLPDNLEQEFKQQVLEYERSKSMPYVTSIERLAKEEGRNEGRLKGMAETIVRLLRQRWKGMTPEMERQIRSLSLPQLESLTEILYDFATLTDLEIWLGNMIGRPE